MRVSIRPKPSAVQAMSQFSLKIIPVCLSVLLSSCLSSGGGSSNSAPVQANAANLTSPALGDMLELSIEQTQAAMKNGSLTCVQLVESYLDRIQRLDRAVVDGNRLNSVLRIAPHVREEAAALDALQASGGWADPLHCVPTLLKDNYDTADFPTTAASKSLDGMQPVTDAFTVQRLRAAGAVVLGKTTMAEFAYLPQSVNSQTLRVALPYDTSRDTGGSSSGSASAIAANLAMIATGSDTCASIRLPPSNNSLVGIRSSIGLVSQRGIVPLSHTLDVGGPIARTVTDAVRMLDVMAAVDPKETKTLDKERFQPASYSAFLQVDGLKGKRIGVLRSYGGTDAFGSDPHVNKVMNQAIKDLVAQGAVIVDNVTLPNFSQVSTTMIVREFKDNIEEYLAGVPNAPHKTLAGIIASGKVHPVIEALLVASQAASDTKSTNYQQDRAKREPLRQYVESEMNRLGLDALIYPPVKSPPQSTLVEADTAGLIADLMSNPMGASSNVNASYQSNNCDFSSTLGLPSIVVPAGFSSDAKPLPIGIEFFGRKWDEGRLISMAYAYEQATKHRKSPPSYK